MEIFVVILLLLILFVTIVVLLTDWNKERNRKKRLQAEKLRREKIIAEITGLSSQIDSDPQCNELFKYLDEVILPEKSSLKSISFNGYTVKVSFCEPATSAFGHNNEREVKIDASRYGLSLASDNRKVALVYSLKKRYPFTKYSVQKPNNSGVTPADLVVAFFDSGDEYGHDSALFLCGPRWHTM